MRGTSHREIVVAQWILVSNFLLFSTLGVAVLFVEEFAEPREQVWLMRGGVLLTTWLWAWAVIAAHFRVLRRHQGSFSKSNRLGSASIAALTIVAGAILWGAILATA